MNGDIEQTQNPKRNQSVIRRRLPLGAECLQVLGHPVRLQFVQSLLQRRYTDSWRAG